MNPTFGQIIRTARADKGYSQRDLARLVEIDFTYLSKLESDATEYPPKEYVIQQLAYYLGLDYEELVCLTGRLPERYQDFLQQNYQVMPALFRWMRQKPGLAQRI
ncbi:helix-turn-helix domain-containing protein [Aliterella atlantica]|uniref:XRE family transcriptional regulator n=1 Tax=Aliterella atlantica CENA595 TaxID=1618023 RepID=A0A0D8ZMX0_9CYAN|nr:helix-turn-helix transcriptional regulator [Aliterella atlantica]KJH69799.1 XRE family transcriptional regulator [Aliterella atlantica CENA595]